MNFELLLAKDLGTYYQIIGITYSNAMLVQSDCTTLKASLYTVETVKAALKAGKKITVAKAQDYSELLPEDLVIEEVDELERYKLIAINEVSARMHQMLISISIIDLMEYLNNYVSLLNAGYFITDANREDKYFEVIEASQECEEPKPLDDKSTFEDEQKYIAEKQKYDVAQFNLKTLEKYLNSYDKLSQIKHRAEFLTDTREKIQKAVSKDEIDNLMKIYRSNLENYKMVK